MRERHPGARGGPRRPLRVGAEIKKMMPELIRRHIRLPEDILVTVVDVEVTSDLSLAKIYFSVFSASNQTPGTKIAKLLNDRKGAFRKEIAHRMVMRQHPQLQFVLDETEANAARIEELLRQVNTEHKGESPSQ